jgi:hypothetical protein
MNQDELLHACTPILTPDRVWSRDEVRSRPCPVPRRSGLYGWYFNAVPPGVPTDGCNRFDGLTLLYAGIAPGFANSRGHLRKRIRTHYRSGGRSTLRRDLGLLLERELDLQVALQRDRVSFFYGETEDRLTEWMSENAFVVWHEHDEPWTIEREIMRLTSLPLNLHHNSLHPFYATLRAQRADCRRRAQLLSSIVRPDTIG